MSKLAAKPPKCGVLIVGSEPVPPETLAAAAACDEVLIVARAVRRVTAGSSTKPTPTAGRGSDSSGCAET